MFRLSSRWLTRSVGVNPAGSPAKAAISTSPSNRGRRQVHPNRRRTRLTSLSGPTKSRMGARDKQSATQVATEKAHKMLTFSGERVVYRQNTSRIDETKLATEPNARLAGGNCTAWARPALIGPATYAWPW